MSSLDATKRCLSGMRPTGRLHIGHLHGCLENWVKLQHQYDCYFFVADWHALTTAYHDTSEIEQSTIDMIIDWLAAGLSPSACTMFVQSKVPEHAELMVLLSMITPRAWLERVPSYKDQIERLNDRDLDTFGFLGYPVLQAADILMYRAGHVPVGADQQAHVEATRDIARRFNETFGRDEDFEQKAQKSLAKLGSEVAAKLTKLRRAFVEQGDADALARAQTLLDENLRDSVSEKERLHGYLEGVGRIILPEPNALITKEKVVTGLDGQKMSKSTGNTISLREDRDVVESTIRRMPTDPARVRRTDPGEPNKCPVYSMQKNYLSGEQLAWVENGCRTASIGCIDCKKPLIEAINEEQESLRQEAEPYLKNPDLVRDILVEGSEKARVIAKETMDDVRAAVGISHRSL